MVALQTCREREIHAGYTLVRSRARVVGASRFLEDSSEIFTAPEIPDSNPLGTGFAVLSLHLYTARAREISVFKVGTRALMHLCIIAVDRTIAHRSHSKKIIDRRARNGKKDKDGNRESIVCVCERGWYIAHDTPRFRREEDYTGLLPSPFVKVPFPSVRV